MCECRGCSNEKVNEQSEEKCKLDDQPRRAADRQRNRRIRQTGRSKSEQHRNGKCSSAAKLIIVTAGLRTALVFLLFVSLKCKSFLTKRRTKRDADKTKGEDEMLLYLSGDSLCLTWRPCCKEGRGDNTREEGGGGEQQK